MNRSIRAAIAAVLATLVLVPSVLAHECVNASKSDQQAGAQVLFGPSGEILWATEGALRRIERGLVDPVTGDGFHGLVAFDFDGDGQADVSTWFGVGPDGEIPLRAQLNGPVCRGLTNAGLYFEQCVGT